MKCVNCDYHLEPGEYTCSNCGYVDEGLKQTIECQQHDADLADAVADTQLNDPERAKFLAEQQAGTDKPVPEEEPF